MDRHVMRLPLGQRGRGGERKDRAGFGKVRHGFLPWLIPAIVCDFVDLSLLFFLASRTGLSGQDAC
jgi:hypothetical protein